MNAQLPIHSAIPALLKALRQRQRCVLQAPPGAGKTTVVPLEILRENLTSGRIVMLEPRRLAARAAATRMADTLGETVGQTVGYRIRGEAKISKATRIEVVTEGILTRMIQSDPELSEVGCVIFDEFHERSLNADLGLALSLEIAEALREDLHLVVMSATLDATPVAALMHDAPVITSEGRAFPVDIRWLDKSVPRQKRLDDAMADLSLLALKDSPGSALVFLPGEGEIRQVAARLKDRVPTGCSIHPLFGAMDFKAQQAAIAPAPSGRKIVLATSIAETSLTIEDIRIVVDAGRARRARFSPQSGMSQLVTESASRAEATQRTGRAGRVAAGVCYRLWTKGEEGALPAFAPAEIEIADLTGLALELALWGARAEDLALLTQPNAGSLAEAQALLRLLGALDAENRITEHGRVLAALPVHPRLAHMLAVAGQPAAPLAALLSNRDPLARTAPADLSLRLTALRDPKGFRDRHPYEFNRAALERIRQEAKRLSKGLPQGGGQSDAEMAALAYPDRIALRRKGDVPRYLLSGGKGAVLAVDDPLAQSRLLVATDLDGNPKEARIRQAIPLAEAELRGLYGDQIEWSELCTWSKRDRRVMARRQECFGAIVLDDRQWNDAPKDAIARAMLEGVHDLGLTWSDAARRFAARVRLVQDLPDMSEAALLDSSETWLLPYLDGIRDASGWRSFDITDALRARLDWDQMQRLDAEVPAHFTTPLGRRIPIDYDSDPPEISLRLQEMFGQTSHPMVGHTPLKVTLLSPAGRPVQTTTDIPGFWDHSYADVRKDMRGRYPKHPWPENPREADPTLRAKRRPL